MIARPLLVMSFKPRADLPQGAFTLPARYYTDPAIFAREQSVFYRRGWVGIGSPWVFDAGDPTDFRDGY